MEAKRIFNIIGLIAIIVILAIIISKYIPQEGHSNNQEKQWVWIELSTELPRDTTDYFYYGQINKVLLEKIDSKEDIQGLFTLSNIRYWNDEDLLQLYENDNHLHFRIFQIKAIQEIIPYKDDPVNLFDEDELHESLKSQRVTKNN